MQVPIIENVLKANDEVAALNRHTLGAAGVFSVNLIGAPGSGKTAVIEATCRALGRDLRFAAIAGDLATQRDADRLADLCDQIVQINTGKGCHLDANQVRRALDQIDLPPIDVLFIENVGNLICPVGFDLGQDVKVGVFSVAEGDDKAAKHPYIVREAEVLLLNKMDLLPHVPFDLATFRQDVQLLRPQAQVLELSATSPDSIDPWLSWLWQQLQDREWRGQVTTGPPRHARLTERLVFT